MSTTRICDVTLKIPPWEYIFSLAATLVNSVFTTVSPRALGDMLIAACSARASPIQLFSLPPRSRSRSDCFRPHRMSAGDSL